MPTKQSVQRILKHLRLGRLVASERNSGKTTALLELAHELGPDKCVIVVFGFNAARDVHKMWANKYGPARIMTVVSGDQMSNNFLAGLAPGTKILVDEFWNNRYQGSFFAAVWTPPFETVDLTFDIVPGRGKKKKRN